MLSELERAGGMIGFGLVTSLSYLLGRSMQLQGDTINVFALVGGLGFGTLCFGIYLLIKNRKDIKIEYTDEYKIYREKEDERKRKLQSDSEVVLRRYESMPYLHIKDGSES